jgi:hypothetical protein
MTDGMETYANLREVEIMRAIARALTRMMAMLNHHAVRLL